jgi:hypothetical protein
MTDKSANQQIAELMKAQTFEERMKMAAIFRDMAIDATRDDAELDLNWFMHAFDNWANAELEDGEPA